MTKLTIAWLLFTFPVFIISYILGAFYIGWLSKFNRRLDVQDCMFISGFSLMIQTIWWGIYFLII